VIPNQQASVFFDRGPGASPIQADATNVDAEKVEFIAIVAGFYQKLSDILGGSLRC